MKTKEIYKVFTCSICRKILELKLVGKEYKGYCKTCKRNVTTKREVKNVV